MGTGDDGLPHEVPMKRFPVSISLLILSVLFAANNISAQPREGTVEASWKRAAQGESMSPSYRVQEQSKTVAPRVEAPRATAWDEKRSAETRPWAALPANPTPRDYHSVNTVVIDSLSHLYCLSPGYVTTLRSRNEEAFQGGATAREREFSYSEGGRAVTRETNRPSLQALYKELMQLLDRCLAGR